MLYLPILQIRWYAYRRPNEQPGLIGRFIENLKEGFERNKEMQVYKEKSFVCPNHMNL